MNGSYNVTNNWLHLNNNAAFARFINRANVSTDPSTSNWRKSQCWMQMELASTAKAPSCQIEQRCIGKARRGD
jgi:hypothetical protein